MPIPHTSRPIERKQLRQRGRAQGVRHAATCQPTVLQLTVADFRHWLHKLHALRTLGFRMASTTNLHCGGGVAAAAWPLAWRLHTQHNALQTTARKGSLWGPYDCLELQRKGLGQLLVGRQPLLSTCTDRTDGRAPFRPLWHGRSAGLGMYAGGALLGPATHMMFACAAVLGWQQVARKEHLPPAELRQPAHLQRL